MKLSQDNNSHISQNKAEYIALTDKLSQQLQIFYHTIDNEPVQTQLNFTKKRKRKYTHS